jgi:hypothetical protein
VTAPGRAGVAEHEGAPRQDTREPAGARTVRTGGEAVLASLREGGPVPAAALRELAPAGNGAVTRLLIARAATDTATPPASGTPGPVGAPAAGRPVGRYARVGRVDPFLSVRTEMDPREVTMLPDPLVADTLTFNDRVFVLEEYPQDWVKVRTDNGNIGYTYGKKLFVGMPDPQARLHQVESGETALGIAQRTYKCGDWGSDGRFFVNVLVAVNEASGDPAQQKGILKKGGGDADSVESWKDTELLSGYWIWLPSEEFARSLAGTVSSGSVSYEAWQQVEGLVGFAVGVLEGVATTLADLVMGLVDLVSMIIDLVVDVVRNGIAAKVGELREFFDKLDVAEIASALWADFVQRWNAPDAYDRWLFRGLVVGMVLAEIALAVLSGGGTLAVKVAGKAGQLAKLAAKLARLDAVTDFARGVDKAADATEAGRKARAALRTAEPDAPVTSGPRTETVEEFLARGGKIEKLPPGPTPEPEFTAAPKQPDDFANFGEGPEVDAMHEASARQAGARAGRSKPDRGQQRPHLPSGPSAARAELNSFREPFRDPVMLKEQEEIMELAKVDPKAAGRRYQDLVAGDFRGGRDVQEKFTRPGRRMDMGTEHEMTMEGVNGSFGTEKLNQLWDDLADKRNVTLTVPKLSDEARDQLARLLAQARAEFGPGRIIVVRETLP